MRRHIKFETCHVGVQEKKQSLQIRFIMKHRYTYRSHMLYDRPNNTEINASIKRVIAAENDKDGPSQMIAWLQFLVTYWSANQCISTDLMLKNYSCIWQIIKIYLVQVWHIFKIHSGYCRRQVFLEKALSLVLDAKGFQMVVTARK